MHPYNATDLVLIITAIGTAICSIIAAFKSNKANKSSKRNGDMLDEVHRQTNGNLSKMRDDIYELNRKNERLNRVIAELANECEPGTLLKVRTRVDDMENALKNKRRAGENIQGNAE